MAQLNQAAEMVEVAADHSKKQMRNLLVIQEVETKQKLFTLIHFNSISPIHLPSGIPQIFIKSENEKYYILGFNENNINNNSYPSQEIPFY